MSPSNYVKSQHPSILPHVDASTTEPIERLPVEQHVQLALGNQDLDLFASNSNPKDNIVAFSTATSTDTMAIGSSQQNLVPLSNHHEPLISEVLPSDPTLINHVAIQNPPKMFSDDARLLEVQGQSYLPGANQGEKPWSG